jgi:hypothetical protein
MMPFDPEPPKQVFCKCRWKQVDETSCEGRVVGEMISCWREFEYEDDEK